MAQWAWDARKNHQSPLVVVDFFFDSGLVVTDLQHLRHVMDRNQKNYAKDTALSYKPFLPILGTSIITSHGDRWRQHRNLLGPAFRVDILQETADVAKRAVDRLSAKLELLRGTGKTIELAEEFRVMTLEVIGELILSLTPDESGRVFPDLYLPIVEEANLRIWHPYRAYLPTPANFQFQKTVAALNAYVSQLIRTRWAARCATIAQTGSFENKDILDRVIAACDPATWSEATVLDLRDQIKSFILAGHETSAAMLTWTIFELSQSPAARARVLAEGKAVFPACVGPASASATKFEASPLPSREQLDKLDYTVCALKESLRRHSLVPVVTRNPLQDDVLGEQPVPAGTKIFCNIKAVHMDPTNWPEPEAYRPERFQADFDPYAFLPFVNGPRNCLGQHLALLEARIVLSLLTQRFVFTPALGAAAGEEHPFTVPVVPRHGMHVTVT